MTSSARPGRRQHPRLPAVGAATAMALAACLLAPAAAEARSGPRRTGRPPGAGHAFGDQGDINADQGCDPDQGSPGAQVTRRWCGRSRSSSVRRPVSPDPDAPPTAISDQASADAAADRLRSKGFSPRVEPVAQPRAVDVVPGTLGCRVRVGSWPSKAAADAVRAEVIATGESANSVYAGWDGDRLRAWPMERQRRDHRPEVVPR